MCEQVDKTWRPKVLALRGPLGGPYKCTLHLTQILQICFWKVYPVKMTTSIEYKLNHLRLSFAKHINYKIKNRYKSDLKTMPYHILFMENDVIMQQLKNPKKNLKF